jgi:hypothetical protein
MALANDESIAVAAVSIEVASDEVTLESNAAVSSSARVFRSSRFDCTVLV